MKILSRIGLLTFAAALAITLMWLWSEALRFPANPGGRMRRHRPPEPQLARLPGFAGQAVIVVLIAVAGRKILRLRL